MSEYRWVAHGLNIGLASDTNPFYGFAIIFLAVSDLSSITSMNCCLLVVQI